MSIKAVLFDMDGVLVDSMPDFAKVWQALAARVGAKLEAGEVYLREGEKAEDTLAELFRRAGKPAPAPEQVRDLLDLLARDFRAEGEKPLFAENVQIARKLSTAGYRVGLVTGNGFDYARAMLGEDLLAVFDPVVTGADVVRGKPAPDPYLEAARRLGLKPEECLVIENSPGGVRSAKAAGMTCAAFTSTVSAEHLPGADFTYMYSEELLRIFRRLGVEANIRILYFCSRSGNCCRGRGDVALTGSDLARLASFLGLEEKEFIERYCRLENYHAGLSLKEKDSGEDCVFLDGDGCRVYEARPEQCRGFPNEWNYEGFENICRATKVIV